MARAGVASASARPDSIKGLAQSIAKPAYRRLLNAEPLLRRAVPVLIIAFLATICVGAVVQVLDHRRQTLNDMVIDARRGRRFRRRALRAPVKNRRRDCAAAAGARARAAVLGDGGGPAFHAHQRRGRGAAATPATTQPSAAA